MASGKSCYVVELSVQPGGSRWAELHAYPDVHRTREVIETFFRNEDNLAGYHAVWYGATLGVWVVQRGVPVQFIDLHPHVSVDLGGATGKIKLDHRDVLDAFADEEDDVERYAALQFTVDWPAIAAQLPRLDAPLLDDSAPTPIETFRIGPDDSYLRTEDELALGGWDSENGERLD